MSEASTARSIPAPHPALSDDEPPPASGPAPAGEALHTLALPDGSTAQLEGGVLSVRGPDGMLRVRYAEGVVEIAPEAGDLRLAAPAGRVVISAGLDVTIEAARDVSHKATRAIRLEGASAAVKTKKLEVEAKSSRLVTGRATVLARSIATSAEEIASRCVRYELEATKLVERTRDAFREVAGLAESRIGRARTVVKDVFSLRSRRSVMVSEEDTSVDGKRILIG